MGMVTAGSPGWLTLGLVARLQRRLVECTQSSIACGLAEIYAAYGWLSVLTTAWGKAYMHIRT